ncbi:MAG: DUF4126 domain-containing protein, partial [Bacteroidota bacterium]
ILATWLIITITLSTVTLKYQCAMIELVAAFFIGLGLAASVGFRIFLPLLALSIASYFDIIPVNESFEWIGTVPAMVTLPWELLQY